MTFQPTDDFGNASLPENVEMTAPEQDVLRHLTAAWTAFLQLPTERVEYVLAFQAGCQDLQRQVAARPANRMSGPIMIPAISTALGGAPVAFVKRVDPRTPLQKVLDRKAQQNAQHKQRREEQKAADPEGFREKERQKWQRRKARQDATLAAAGYVKRRRASAAPKSVDTPPAPAQDQAPDLKPPPGLSQSARKKWRYNNDPDYRGKLLQWSRDWRKKTGYKQKPRSPEAQLRAKLRKERRLQTDPEYAEKVRAKQRIKNAKYREALKALAKSRTKEASSEVRVRQLRADPIYSAAHAALPATMAPHHRADIVSDIIMAVLEGQITLDEVPKKAKSFITAHHRRSETYATVSLDAPIGDGKATMHDFVTEGLWSQETMFSNL